MVSSATYSTTIIIPTLCNLIRADSLMRAIRSVTASCSDPVSILVCINGDQVDEQLAATLGELTDVTCIRIEAPSVALARAAGRRAVSTPFFGFLDDDDEFLEGSITRHLLNLRAAPALDVSVCNGFRQVGANRELVLNVTTGIESDPLRALFQRNWLASCGGLFREATVGLDFFEEMPPYGEWTWLAFKLAMSGKQVRVIGEPGYVVHDSPQSLSKGGTYKASYITLYEQMRRMQPPEDIISLLQDRACDAFHDLSVEMLTEGRLREATRFHLKSIRFPYGLKYLSFTRHLVIRIFAKASAHRR